MGKRTQNFEWQGRPWKVIQSWQPSETTMPIPQPGETCPLCDRKVPKRATTTGK